MHVGFALQRLDEQSALETLAMFRQMGELDDRVRRPLGAARPTRPGCTPVATATTEEGRGEVPRRVQRPRAGRRLLDDIHGTATRPWAMMEVCGGQTHSIIRHGIDQLLPGRIELIHGPGCPVCVTPLEMIDKALAIASPAGRDLLLVRRHAAGAGQRHATCSRSRATGGDVRVVYSPLDAVDDRPGEPRPAGGVLRDRLRDDRAAQRDDGPPGASGAGIENFTLLVSHVLVPPAIEAIMTSPGAGCRPSSPPVTSAR